MKRDVQKDQLLMVTLVVGFFIGIIYENIVSERNGISIQIFRTEQLVMYQNMIITGYSYLFYVLKKRIIPLVLIMLLWNFKWRKPFVILAVGWCGVLLGRIIVSSMMLQGIKGVLICLAALFPQYIFYSLIYMILFWNLYSDKRRQWNKAKVGVMIGIFSLGIVTEVYVNPIILKWVLEWI